MNEITKYISINLQSLRQERNWSLDKAAEETGINKEILAQIERGESDPAISTLWKIANGFKVSLYSLTKEPHPPVNELIHGTSKIHHTHPLDDKINVIPFFRFDRQLKFELFILELLPDCHHICFLQEPGVIEHIIVIEGKIEVFANDAWHPLNKGEGLRFKADQRHGFRNLNKESAWIHEMAHHPV